MQIIFQDPQSSLDPRMKVGPIIEEPMKAHGLYDADGRANAPRSSWSASVSTPSTTTATPTSSAAGSDSA